MIVVVGVVLMAVLPGGALLELLTVGTVISAVLYGAIILLYLAVRRRLDRKEGAFDLGRFELPVAIGALLWSAVVLFVIVSPSSALTSILIAVGLLLAGGLYFAYLLIFKREVLDTEPGDADVFSH
jgi:amino acid transporter